ncbi:hypothetical protein [Streptomyces pratensis]|uniref:hypothetical protein n=1 Tax=Streptomyces pratensis TaxID=1169025 RepID=UPI001933F227|nr:hypothetical protein [Streptomyces pratensis]
MADLSFYVSPLSEEIREEGRAQGRAEGILIVLRARGLDVAHTTREKVTACRDPELLRQWLGRSARVAIAEAIFSEQPLGRYVARRSPMQ